MSYQSLAPTLIVAALAVAPLAAQDRQPPSAASAPKPFSPEEEARYLALGKKYVRWFLNGYADSLATVTPKENLDRNGGANGIREHIQMVAERAGTETTVLAEKMTRRNGTPQFWHEGTFNLFTDEPLVIRFLLDEKGMIVGTGMGPKSQAPSDPK